jgi:hypothetical protein
MFIIFGFKGRLTSISSGVFYCSRCGCDCNYILEGIKRWFTFFFIPIFPVSGIKAEQVRCTTCQGTFRKETLSLPTGKAMEEIIGSAFRRCAVATLKAGNSESVVSRAAAVAYIEGFFSGNYSYDEDTLDQDLKSADLTMMSVYANPVVNRIGIDGAEYFVSKCIQIALADGPLSAQELETLRALGGSFDLSEAHLNGIIASSTPVREHAIENPPTNES